MNSVRSDLSLLRLAAFRERDWVLANERPLPSLLDTQDRFHALDRSGWLAHHTTPFNLLDPAQQEPAVARWIVEAYQYEWRAVDPADRDASRHSFIKEDQHAFADS